MMLALAPVILAQNDDGGPIRFLGILVIVGLFVLGNIVQWLQKYQAQKRKLERQRQAAAPPVPQAIRRPGPPQAGAPSPRSIAGTLPGTAIRRAIAAQRMKAAQRATPVRKPVPSPPPLPATHAASRRPAARPVQAAAAETEVQSQSQLTQHRPAAGQDITASEIGSHAQATTTRANKLQVLLNPRSLRQIFVLTEILQPPVSIREPRP